LNPERKGKKEEEVRSELEEEDDGFQTGAIE
jgi:hypothetical protein